jgi:hypothetical protein
MFYQWKLVRRTIRIWIVEWIQRQKVNPWYNNAMLQESWTGMIFTLNILQVGHSRIKQSHIVTFRPSYQKKLPEYESDIPCGKNGQGP